MENKKPTKQNSKTAGEFGTMLVTAHYGKKQVKSESQSLEVREFESEVARVSANFGLTINLGNYESAKVGVTVELPCYPEEKDAALKEAFEVAHKEMERQVADIQKDKRGA